MRIYSKVLVMSILENRIKLLKKEDRKLAGEKERKSGRQQERK
jgi:hypothetical protein